MGRTSHPILFYDGECGLCDRTVRAVIRRDKRRVFRFAPLGGETFAALRRDDLRDDRSTVVLLDGDTVFVRSDAALEVLRRLGGGYRVASVIGGCCPRVIRDALYRLIARHRRRLFGGADACRLPTPAESDRLLP